MKIDITKIVVLTRNCDADKVFLHTTLPSPFPPELSNEPLVISFNVTKGKGKEYARDNFKIEPEIVET